MSLSINQAFCTEMAAKLKPKHEEIKKLFEASEATAAADDRDVNQMRAMLSAFFSEIFIADFECGVDNALVTVLKTVGDDGPLYLMTLPMAFDHDSPLQADILHDFDRRKLPITSERLNDFSRKLVARLAEPGIEDALLEAAFA